MINAKRRLFGWMQVLAVLTVAGPCIADAGDLDPTFGSGGKVVTENLGQAKAVAIQADGKLVVAMSTVIARYNADGSLDTGFGIDGVANTAVAGTGNHTEVAIQSDGKIVSSGHNFDFFFGSEQFGFHAAAPRLVRLNVDGSLDATFGSGGVAIVEVPIPDAGASRLPLAIQSDGKIVIAFVKDCPPDHFICEPCGCNPAQQLAVARLNPNGTLDVTFGSSGVAVADFSFSLSVAAIALQSDGKIVVAGSSQQNTPDYALARFETNGTVDVGFGSGGLVVTDFFSSKDQAQGLAIDALGRITVAGVIFSFSEFNTVFGLARYLPNGDLDPSFGTGGLVTTAFGPGEEDYARAVTLQPDGKIIVVGGSDREPSPTPSFYEFAVLRYNFNGSLDCTFGDGGVVITDFGADIASAWGVAVQPDGKIVVVGHVSTGPFTGLGVARFEGESLGDTDSDCDGLLDSTELDIAEGSGCPDPFDFDSDGDLLGDGEEVALGTNPCDPDTDGDGVLDNVDPLPLDPGVTQDFLEQLTRDLCAAIQALDLALFTGQNDNAKAGRRNSLANRACLAANAIVNGQVPSAIALLQSLIEKIDGSDPDWMDDSPEKDALAAEIDLLIILLLL